jgi:acetylornithine deacetylase/succinyl-diaminopimelate desuccinylase-like protein
MSEVAIHQRPAELLQRLIRFDTANPPGGERACIEWAQQLLEEGGCDVQIVAQDPERPSLMARLRGEGRAPALLFRAMSRRPSRRQLVAAPV